MLPWRWVLAIPPTSLAFSNGRRESHLRNIAPPRYSRPLACEPLRGDSAPSARLSHSAPEQNSPAEEQTRPSGRAAILALLVHKTRKLLAGEGTVALWHSQAR